MSGSADAGGLLQSSEYRARHVNDECSEAAAPLPGVRKGTEYANVIPLTWTAKGKNTTLYVSFNIFILKMKKIHGVWIADKGLHTEMKEQWEQSVLYYEGSRAGWTSEGLKKDKQVSEPSV